MISLGGLMDDDSVKRIAEASVVRGNVYRIKMDISNGVVPKQGDDSRNKFFVVLGKDDEGNIYGGVIINSEINKNIPSALKDLHMPISNVKYRFLEHKSFVDCSTLMVVKYEKFVQWHFLGSLDTEDSELVRETLKTSPKVSKIQIARFNL